jgi:diguanylate cyclase (GGDEF)-like protein/PAS domain S-box-containing protein
VDGNNNSNSLSPDLLRSVIGGVSDAVLITDAELDLPGPRILYVNRAFEQMTGYSMEELHNETPRILQGPLTDSAELANLRSTLRAGKPFSAEVVNYRKEGTPFEVQWRIWACPPPPAEPQHFVSVQRDVTQEKAILSHRRQLSLLHRVSESVANEGLDLDLVRRRVAELAMEITGADAAVVEEPHGDQMVYRAVAGTAHDQIGLRLPIDGSLSGLCFRQQRVLVTDDTEHDDRVHKEAVRRVGMRSGILAPLMHKRHCYGVLKVYAGEPHRFTEADQQLLMLASHILASALFDAAAFDAEVRKRHLLLDAAPILLAYLNTEYRYEEVNATHEPVFGLTAGEIRGRKLSDLLGEHNFDRLRPYLDGAFAGQSMNFEIPFLKEDGEEVLYNGNLEPHRGADGSVIGCYMAAQDITKIKLAEVDFLTGLSNRRRFEEIGRFMLESGKRGRTSFTFLMIDIDHFKHVNDTYGHSVGDEVLKDFGEILHKATRASDAACRWGGEEFALLLHDADAHHARTSAERLLSSVRSHPFAQAGHITASIGLAEARHDESLPNLQHRADDALYTAKRSGRDRVVVNNR